MPAIRVVEKDGKLYTLDNRRLEAFKQAGVDVRYQKVKLEDVADEFKKKFSTKNDGESVRVR